MTAQIIPFRPRAKTEVSIVDPLAMFYLGVEANLFWLQKFNEFADTTPSEYTAPSDESA